MEIRNIGLIYGLSGRFTQTHKVFDLLSFLVGGFQPPIQTHKVFDLLSFLVGGFQPPIQTIMSFQVRGYKERHPLYT